MEEEKKEFNTDNVDDTVYDDSKLLGRIQNNGKKAVDWIKRNKELFIMGLIGLFGAIVGIADTHNKNEKKRENHEKVYRSIYDRSNGNYVISKKDITPSQQKEINRRRNNGEDLYEICDDLGIKLKR